MLSLQFIRENTELVRQSLAKRQDTALLAELDSILGLDEERRRLLTESEGLRARRRQVSKEIGRMKEKPSDGLKLKHRKKHSKPF